LIFGTGFRVVDYLASMRIVGARVTSSNDVWKTSVRNYLGINVSGFPTCSS